MMKSLIAAVALVGAASAANASITPDLQGSPVALGGGNYAWNYSVLLTPDQRLVSGSYFTIYDFRSLVDTGVTPAGWTVSSALLGVTPATVLPEDDATIANVTFTYNGPTITPPDSVTGVFLGLFQIIARTDRVSFDSFSSRAVRNGGLRDGTVFDTVGQTSVPGVVPEPQSWAMLIVGLGLVGATLARECHGDDHTLNTSGCMSIRRSDAIAQRPASCRRAAGPSACYGRATTAWRSCAMTKRIWHYYSHNAESVGILYTHG
jgi:hypothetical protein